MNMETTNLDGRESVLRRTDEFIESLKATPVVRRFNEASRRFEADQEVQSLMGTLRRFQQAQQTGGVLANELQDVRDAQMRIRNHRVVQEFLAARDAVGAFLQETNQAISEVMGIDFGQTAGPAGGAC
jgi:cell fate (sporulation/competence/biofilm development) regulator YlbF (YheA/YmcA/DUF963 family)